jgi:hypothetical protein
VGACNRVSPIHLKVYVERSPGKQQIHVVLTPFEYRTAVIFPELIPKLNAFQISGGIYL